ncbi:hypothetical protein V2G26_020013 [Clonostachys chloroleuca]
MCFLAEKDIPESILSFVEDEIERDEAIAALQAYAFITKREDDTAFDIHRLVHLAMRNHLKGEYTTESVTMMVQHLCEIYPFPEYKNQGIWMRYMPHVLTAAEMIETSADK